MLISPERKCSPVSLTRNQCARNNGSANLTLSVDDEIVRQARAVADATGTSVNQLVRDYLAQVAGKTDHEADARELERLSRLAKGNSRGWKFNREDLHGRK
jgi:antitoxin component of RelBE/YafQ-DinJ toxin-antitoxin module